MAVIMSNPNTTSLPVTQTTAAWLLILVAGCTTTNTTHGRHVWERRAPRGLYATVAEVAPTRVRPVAAAKRAEASERLKDADAVHVSESDAMALAGGSAEVTGDYVLVRGLCVGCGTGKFWVYENEEVLIVDDFGLAHRRTPATKWPILVKRTEMPRDVFISAGAAQ